MAPTHPHLLSSNGPHSLTLALQQWPPLTHTHSPAMAPTHPHPLSSNDPHSTGSSSWPAYSSREHHTNFSFCAKLCLLIGCHLITWKVKNSASTPPFLPPPHNWFSHQHASLRLPATNEGTWRPCIHFLCFFLLCPSTPENHPVLSCRCLIHMGRKATDYFSPKVFFLLLSVEKWAKKPKPK